MKKAFLLSIISALVLSGYAQPDAADAPKNNPKAPTNDTVKIKWRGYRIWYFTDPEMEKAKADSTKSDKSYKKEFAHWGGFDFGVSMLTTASNQIQIPDEDDIYDINYFLDLKYNRSWYFSLNLIEKPIRLYKNRLVLITGLGMEWNSYNFRKQISLDANAEYTNSGSVMLDTSTSVKYVKNQLKATYVKAPLLLQYNSNPTNPDKSFHIAVGTEFGYKIDSWTKQKLEKDDYVHKFKRHADYNISNFKYGLSVRAGYGRFTLFTNYLYTPLFDEDKGPETPVFPLTAGLSVNF